MIRGPGPSRSQAHGGGLLVRWLRVLLREKLTDTGRLVFWLFWLATTTGMASFVVKIYFLWSALLGLLAISILASRLARVRLLAELQTPRNTLAGNTLELPLRLSNPTRRTARDLQFSLLDPPAGLDWTRVPLEQISPGEERVLSLPVRFPRRGHLILKGVRQDNVFPWGLWRDTRRLLQPRSLLVYPTFHPLLGLDIPVGRRYQPGGIALTSHVGESTEFVSTREFRTGDSLRNIHWRSWGRLGRPVVKEFQEEYFCRIALLLDTYVPSRKGEEAFEAAISLAASVANRLALEEYVVDLFAAGLEVHHFQAGRSLAYLENVMDILACVEACPEPPFQKIEPVLLDHMGNITTTIAFLLAWDDQRAGMLRAIQDRGSALKILLIQPEAPPLAEHPLLGPIHWIPPERVRSGGVETL